MDDDALDRLFSGDVEGLVGLPKRVVRLFISSTFTDMVNERNSLMERVYPRLKKYCRERYGLDFQGKLYGREMRLIGKKSKSDNTRRSITTPSG